MVKLRISDATRCRRTARTVLDECGLDALPIHPEEICHKKGILYSHDADLPAGIWGALLREDGEFVILVSAICPTVGNRRFSAGHELGALPFVRGTWRPCCLRGSITPVLPAPRPTRLSLKLMPSPLELLMPEALVSPIVVDSGIGLSSVQAIAGRSETSLTSAAIRYCELTPDPVSTIVSYEGDGRILLRIAVPVGLSRCGRQTSKTRRSPRSRYGCLPASDIAGEGQGSR